MQAACLPACFLPVTCLLQYTAILLLLLNYPQPAFCLFTGILLRSLTFPSAIHSIWTDPGDHALFAGSGDGSIFETSLVGEVASIEGSDEQREAGYYTMEGQNGAVTCLAMTTDATQMVSGGHLFVYSAVHLVCLGFCMQVLGKGRSFLIGLSHGWQPVMITMQMDARWTSM